MAKSSSAWKSCERLVAKKLSIWWTGNEDAFKRAPVSGGWPKKRSHGDIVANDDVDQPDEVIALSKEFMRLFAIDVKRRVQGSTGTWNLEQLLAAPKHPILDWWADVNALAERLKRMRMLIITKGQRKYTIVFGQPEWDWLNQNIGHNIIPTYIEITSRTHETLFMVDLEVFIKSVPATSLQL